MRPVNNYKDVILLKNLVKILTYAKWTIKRISETLDIPRGMLLQYRKVAKLEKLGKRQKQIVIELLMRQNWTDKRIAKSLRIREHDVLGICFYDKDFAYVRGVPDCADSLEWFQVWLKGLDYENEQKRVENRARIQERREDHPLIQERWEDRSLPLERHYYDYVPYKEWKAEKRRKQRLKRRGEDYYLDRYDPNMGDYDANIEEGWPYLDSDFPYEPEYDYT